ncbi:hypothetical protein FGO68_gene14267 [Halteria grandinella]|uniref:Amino acid transporter transmembrane domain-containing protein n=1 Tax=Halteria grandinella TaxID=5974 RepID=A0A8J8NP74_HALGN|nr:hypothetical protein FGO68_gene14267 [Halteria grandinella]
MEPPSDDLSSYKQNNLPRNTAQPQLYGSLSDPQSTTLQHRDSFISDQKTSQFLTTANIVKSFVGLGILAAPSGYQMVGFIPATLMILINGAVNTYTVHLQTKVKEAFDHDKVQTYTDLGLVCFGHKGEMGFALTILVNQILTCSGYVKFFIEQLDLLSREVKTNERTSSDEDGNKFAFYLMSIGILGVIGQFQSMKAVSYISLVAIISIVTAIAYILFSDIDEIVNPTLNLSHKLCDLSGIPYFYGIASFMFEGNAVQLEIYSQMEKPQALFTNALGNALLFASWLIVLLGSLSYASYGQFTYGVILLNLDPHISTYIVQIIYSIGILCGYCLMIIPSLKILKLFSLYKLIPDFQLFGFKKLKSKATRLCLVILCCSLAYNISDLGQFLNFQGSITGILMTYVFPIACYFKTMGLQGIQERERYMCFGILAYGVIGGVMSAGYAFQALIKINQD